MRLSIVNIERVKDDNDTFNWSSLMLKSQHLISQDKVWTSEDWAALEVETRSLALKAKSEREAWEIIIKRARKVLRTYSTSFFIVTRFLPKDKREAT
jgi:hypothetical protein